MGDVTFRRQTHFLEETLVSFHRTLPMHLHQLPPGDLTLSLRSLETRLHPAMTYIHVAIDISTQNSKHQFEDAQQLLAAGA